MKAFANSPVGVESFLRRIFGSVGATSARASYLTLAVVVLFLGALTVGIMKIEIESNVNDLVISRRGRIAREKKFFARNFDLKSPEVNLVIITPKPGVDIFSVEALDEVYSLQESIRTFEFEYRPGLNVSLEQMCFKSVNADPLEPCWQSSLLASFREGAVFNIGGELNTQYAALFASRPSYRDFNFTTDLKRSFLARTNLNPDSLLLGDFEVDEADGDTITSVGALQIAFGAKSPEGLMNDGLQYFEWSEVESSGDDADSCSDPTRCDACAAEFDPTQFLAAGCTIDGANSQSEGCCAALEDLRASPCVEVLFETRSDLLPVANSLFGACGIESVDLAPRCNNPDLISSTRPASTTSEICACLEGVSNDACTNATDAFLEENPQYSDVFEDAESGEEDDENELSRILTEEIGCPANEAPSQQAQTQATVVTPTTTYEAEITVIKDETETTSKARDVTHEWEKAWRGQMEDVAKQYQYIDVVWLTSTSVDDQVDEAAEADWPLFVLGYGLVGAYIFIFSTFDWKLSGIRFTRHLPGPMISMLSFVLVVFAVVATIGVTGYMSATTSVKVMFSTIQQIPLLMMGLGVNDFFVLCSALNSVMTRSDRPATVEGIMYEMMSIGGTSISLSSAANAVAFALSTLNPVPSILWFGIQMTLGVAISYFVAITAISSLLAIGVRRHLEGKQDPFLRCIRVPFSLPEDELNAEEADKEGPISAGIRRFRWPITFSVFAVVAVWMGFGIHGIVYFDQGLDISESVQKSSYTYDFLTTAQENFDTTQINIVFKDTTDYADPDDFQSVRQSEFEYVDEVYRVEKQLMTLSWMEYYTQYVESKFCSNEICMNEVEWYYDGFSSVEFAHPSKNVCAEAETPEACQEMCQTHCPQGPEDSGFRCQYIEGTTQCFCPYRPKLVSDLFYENPDGFDGKIKSFWADFLNSTAGRASRNFISFDESTATEKNPFGIPQASRAYVFARGLQGVPHQIDHVKTGRRVLDHQDVDVYAFDYLVYGTGERYDQLARVSARNVAIALLAATVVMMPLIMRLSAACIVSFCVLVSVMLTIGSTSWTPINIDFGTYVAFITAVGLSVEFCAHIARAFMLATGDRLTRSLSALRAMGIAVFNGGITTFLGIFPAVLSSFQILKWRLFVQFSIVVAAGVFVGLVFLPVILSLIGPPPFDDSSARSHDISDKEKNPNNEAKNEAEEP